MKKVLKPLLIVLASLVFFVIMAISVALWFVFTPERISPVVQKQANELLTCQTSIGKVELTFFRTFPRFGLKLEDLLLINPAQGATTDTLMNIGSMTGDIDVMAFWRRNEVILSDFVLENGTLHAFIDSLGNTNFDVMVSDSTQVSPEEGSGAMPEFVDLGKISMNNINILYDDHLYKIYTDIRGLDGYITGNMLADTAEMALNLKNALVSFRYAGEQYLNNAGIQLDIPGTIVVSKQKINLRNAQATVNGLQFSLDGDIEMDPETGDIITHVDYQFERWPLKTALALTPPSYLSYLDGIDADGFVSSNGNISGTYNDSVFPLMDIKLMLAEGSLNYVDFPLPLSDMNGEVLLYTDLLDDEISYLDIPSFRMKTPRSEMQTAGRVSKLFSDIHCSLVSTADMQLDEFKPLIPDSINMTMKGRVNGTVKSVFTLTQLENEQIGNMLFSGDISAFSLDVTYDSLWVKTSRSDVGFSLPNQKNTHPNTRFAQTQIRSADFQAGILGDHTALFENAVIGLELSDVRDTTRIPDLLVTFQMDTLSAGNDTLNLALKNPKGKATVGPVAARPSEPSIQLAYSSDLLGARMGETTASMEKIQLDTDIENDQKQEDVFLQWLVKGFIDMEDGRIEMAELTHPIEIPAIKMDFEPEKLDIQDSRIIIDKSDFKLTGQVDNVLSYFRGDSVLLGRFDFVSDNTDVTQLMNLTNGLGYEDETTNNENGDTLAADSDSLVSGPYMVPKGIDILLTTNVRRASFGVDTAVNISGDVRISDGILILGELSFTTPAARMLATAMYRTDRKNHLYLGLDYHMLDIEIEELLQIIPDIDTIMPMLRSFRGQGAFHMAVETYLDSTYTFKPSTLRGAASIEGQNLVLLDGETFSEIANTLRFSKKAENKVDSLSAEFTIFRKEVDVYPFLIVMDRYKAVVGGRHNLDMSFNYHISVVDSPLPLRFGLDIKGNMEDYKITPTSAKYAEFYRPVSRRAVASRQIELRQLIRDALHRNLEEQIEIEDVNDTQENDNDIDNDE